MGAAAYVIYRMKRDKYQMIANWATYLNNVYDSFEAEARALFAASEHLRAIVQLKPYDTRRCWPGTNLINHYVGSFVSTNSRLTQAGTIILHVPCI